MNFPADSIRRYFETRLKDQRLPRSGNGMVKCPFHGDDSPSLSLNIDKGVWNCKAGCGKGGLLDFEVKYSNCDSGSAWVNISEITGEKVGEFGKPEFIWVYTDELGYPISRKIRYPKKPDGKKPMFWQRYTSKGTWETCEGESVRKVPYNLPSVLTANIVVITEGEKCSDIFTLLGLYQDLDGYRVAATTAPDGSGSWKDEYGEVLAGKVVLIFPDNDPGGKKYAETAARSAINHHAKITKIIELPGVHEKEDIENYLKGDGVYTAPKKREDVEALIKEAKPWKPAIEAVENDKFFVGAANFASEVPDAIDWAVKGIIPRGWNGFIIADPKSLKSFSAVNLMLHLALGQDWLGFKVPRRMKTALLAREDHSGLTAWRIKNFLRGMTVTPNMNDLNEWMFVNSRKQEQSFFLDNDDDLARLIGNLKRREVEFVIMDVFRRLHFTDENDNKEMQGILERVSKIQNAVGCAIGIVHHANKGDGFIFNRTRGASVIHGFMEWGIGITTENKDDLPRNWVRKMEFLSKAAGEPDPIYVKPEGSEEQGYLRLVVTQKPEKTKAKKLITKEGNKEFWQD